MGRAKTTARITRPEPPPDATEDEVADWFAETDLSELDLVDVSDERPVDAPQVARGMAAISLRLPNWEIEELRKRAERLGVGYTTYIRLLVNRHVLDEEPIR